METCHSRQDESLREKSSSSIREVQDDGLNVQSPKVVIQPMQSGLCTDTDLLSLGKQKKTPFKLFGGRKSIVSLPSFFGGKHKGFGKGNAKKSLSKSKTHDCISDVPGDVNKKGCYDSVSRHHGHEISKTGNTLPSSLSADSGITSPVKLDFNFHDISPMGSTEGFDKKLGGEKSFSFPRPKKGLKGLFSSIRRHKKSKTLDPEKCERYDPITETVILEQLNRYSSEDAELQGNSEQPKVTDLESEVSPELHNVTVMCEEEDTRQSSVSMPNLTIHQAEELVTETSEELSDQNCCTDSKSECPIDCPVPEVLPDVVNTELSDRDSASHFAGDQLNLMFEDVSSLKSFDSLTGCGDIIAEQDIDNISDTSLSLDRSREATKRSSCLVTYQGGGEEMATPDDIEEEYLQQLLEDGNEGGAIYELEEKVCDEISKGFSKLETSAYSVSAEDAFADRTVLNNAEILTPQSDQQESAPNSDEGYYDSNTPGPDDAGEGFSHKERLPRDSYSGDALYEFYEPDDSLMSPAPGGESLYENKSLCSEIFDQFFDFSLPVHGVLNENPECKKGATETEEERLAVIQKQLLFWEMQREVSLKGLGQLNKHTFSKEKQIECEIRTANFMGRNKGRLKKEQHLVQLVSEDADKGFQHAESGKQSWKDYHEVPVIDSNFHKTYIHNLNGRGDGIVEDPGFELNVDISEAQCQSDATLPAMSNLSNSCITPMHCVQNVFGSDFSSLPDYNPENECDQADNFSQVDFADNGMLFSSISERLGNAGSRSSFHHNLNALPTMVTFDVVDFENESECEQQIDLCPDEEAISPFETFDHRYLQESLAECDEPFLQIGSHQSFHSYNWGVTSLPRHLDQYKLNPSRSVPLSLNRRSKSLDAELLELELGGLQMSKSGLKSCDLLTPRVYKNNSCQCEVACLDGGKSDFNSCNRLRQIVFTDTFKTPMPVLASKPVFGKEPPGSKSSSQLVINRRQTANAIADIVQYNTWQSQEDSGNSENTTKKFACVLPLGEQKLETLYNCSYNSSKKQLKTKPVGITQAMPHQCKKDVDPPADTMDRSGPAKKGILDHRGTSPSDWSNNYNEFSSS